MELKGKKIIFLGDSITEGVGASATDKRYTDLVAQKTGATVYNHGIGGTRIAKQKKPSYDPNWDKDFCSRVKDFEKDADIIVVFGGTNDYGHGDAELGTFSDRTNDALYGALHALYTSLRVQFPFAKIVVMTPLHRVNEESLLNDHNSFVPIAPLKTYVEIIREVAEYYSYPVLDMFKVSGIQPNIPASREAYTVDGVHPNDAGYELISDMVINFLKTL